MNLSRLAAFVVACFPAFISAQTPSRNVAPVGPPTVPSNVAPTEPRLVVRQPAEQAIRIGALRIDVELTPGAAETRIEMRFDNPNGRQLEGELQFPLAPGQTVVGFALDIDGTLRDAVPVDKPRAQAVFEDITRARVDPGLLEVTQGNNYKLRVYPIPARGSRTVVLRIGEAMTARNRAVEYRLPSLPAGEPGSFALRMAAHGFAAAPRVEGDAKLVFARSGASFVATSNEIPKGIRAAVVRAEVSDAARVLVEERSGKTYFHVNLPVDRTEQPRPRPRTIALVWDASGSGAGRDHGREFALLGEYFQALGNVAVKLVFLRDTLESAGDFTVRGGEWNALRRMIEQTAYDGATRLGAIATVNGIDEIVLVSDGLTNFDSAAVAMPSVPTHTVSAAARSNARLLNRIAGATGGRYVDLLSVTPSIAARTLTTVPERIVSVTSDGASDIAIGSPYANDGRVEFAGRLTESVTDLRIELVNAAGRRRTVTQRIDASAPRAGIVAALWGERRLAELEGEYEFNRAAIRRIGVEVGMASRETSLLVLETVDDYVRFEIEPPPVLRAVYDARLATARRAVLASRSTHINRVAAAYSERVKWWERVFPKDARPAPVARPQPGRPGDAESRASGDLARQDRAVAPPSPSVAAAPAPAAPGAPGARARESADARSNRSQSEAKVDGDAAAAPSAPRIQLKPWTPDAPYAKRMQAASPETIYRVYLDERASYTASTAFFLDAADQFTAKGQKQLALRVLSNLAEMDLENRHILRILGYRLMQAGEPRLAIQAFSRVLELAPNEPQSHRDLGLAYAAAGEPQRAIDALYEVVSRPWDGRFPDIEQVAAAEMNAVIATTKTALDTSKIDSRILRNLPVDLRVVLGWDADNTDIDLWVTDPNGERAFYGHRLTYQGGRMSNDFTGGYGPEEFILRNAKPGKYKIEAQFYGHRQQVVAGATTLMLALQTGFGTDRAQEQRVTLRLRGNQEIVFVGEFEVAGTP